MSTVKITTLTDDLEATQGHEVEATEQIRFAYSGYIYDIDLSPENAEHFHYAIAPYVKAGRKAGHIPGRTDILRNGRSETVITQRPTPELTDGSATKSRHSGEADTETAIIRAWAIEKEIMEAGKRGRIPGSIAKAHAASQAGDDGPLNELRALRRALRPPTEPVKQLDHSAAISAATAAETKGRPRRPLSVPDREPGQTAKPDVKDVDETEAEEHYTPLRPEQRSLQMRDEKKWQRRTASGHPRDVLLVEEWTLTERINSLSVQHRTILGQLSGLLDTRNGKVSRLTTGQGHLHSLEFIEYAPESEHGWKVTAFGQYAADFHSRGE